MNRKFVIIFMHVVNSGRSKMYSSGDIDNIKKIILSKIPDTDSIYLFGSYAKGNPREDSDIDIAVLMKILPDWRERKRILNQIYNEAGESGYKVDFIIKSKDTFDNEKTLPTLSRIIDREGKLLWIKK